MSRVHAVWTGAGEGPASSGPKGIEFLTVVDDTEVVPPMCSPEIRVITPSESDYPSAGRGPAFSSSPTRLLP
jgi:hypothetical protein